ncbi:MAG: M1 family metallopeptidase [Sphingobacteriaceae bacterium]|nr:M1 family metallopeptidase [Sphingobacteriaceae bacterium]
MKTSMLLKCAVLLVVFTFCHTKKQTVQIKTEDIPVIQLDTIQVQPAVVENKIYNETPTRINDILHTRLEVNFDWNKSRLNGIATHYIKPHFYPTKQLTLNARGMEILNIEIQDINSEEAKCFCASEKKKATAYPLKYVYENDELIIDLNDTFSSNQIYKIVIKYIAKPNELKKGGSAAISDDKGLYFINPTGENPLKMPQIWTQGETQSNSAWYPTIDNPVEKMSQEILMTVDNKYTTLSNGLLIKSTTNKDGTRTDHWKLEQPHSPYLTMMAVGQFVKVTDEPWKGKEISYYVEREYEPHAKAIFGDTKEMIEFYSSKLGVDYAWPKYAQIAVRDYVSGAMENTSATLHGDFAVYQTTRDMIDGKRGTDIIAHELFHQWFGDLVTCESWSNLPLNESFATYGEYLWEEYKYGRDAADQHHVASKASYMFSGKEVDLIRFDYKHREDMFDGFSYAKGGQVLHMLRKVVGDDAFFASLKNYLETNKYKTAEIHHLRLAFEETTGQDLNWFFNQWFLNKGRPTLNVSKNYNASAQKIEIEIEQKQDFKIAPLYKLPVDIDVYADGKKQRTRIWITKQKETFKIPCIKQPDLVNFDAERQLLCDLNYTKTKEELLFQYKNAPLYGDRHESLKENENQLQDALVYDMFKHAAQYDPFAPLRNYAISKLQSFSDKKEDLKPLFTQIYKADKKTTTRARALEALNKLFTDDKNIDELNEKAFEEASYAINTVALEHLIAKNPKAAMEKAKSLETESGKSLIFTIASLYATQGADEQIHFFNTNMKYINGFELMTYLNDYTKVAKRASGSEAVLMAATDFEWIARGGSRFTRFGAVKGIKDLLSIWETKEKKIIEQIESAKKESKDATVLEKSKQDISETIKSLQQSYERVK